MSLLRRLASVCAFVGAALSAVAPAFAAPRGVRANANETITARFEDQHDVDEYLVDAPRGAVLSVTVRSSSRTVVRPLLQLFAPDGSEIWSVKLRTSRRGAQQAFSYRATETGPYSIRVYGIWSDAHSDPGPYTLHVALSGGDSRIRESIEVTPGTISYVELPGDSDAIAKVKVEEKLGPPLTAVRLLTPDRLPASSSIERTSDHRISGTAYLSGGFGIYYLELVGAPTGGVTTVNVSVQTKFPRPRRSRRTLAAEPRVSSVSPSRGVGGAEVIVRGENLAPGVQVWLGSLRATKVAANGTSNDELVATVPAGPQLLIGEEQAVSVIVEDPDGQNNALPESFTYTGPVLDTSFLDLGTTGDVTGNSSVQYYDNVVQLNVGDIVEDFGDGTYVVRPEIPIKVNDVAIRWDLNRLGRIGSAQPVLSDQGTNVGTFVTTGPATLDDAIRSGSVTYSATPDWSGVLAAQSGKVAGKLRAVGPRTLAFPANFKLFVLTVDSKHRIDWGNSEFAGVKLSRSDPTVKPGLDFTRVPGGSITGTIEELVLTIDSTNAGQEIWAGSGGSLRSGRAHVAAKVDARGTVKLEASAPSMLKLEGTLAKAPPIPVPIIGGSLDLEVTGAVELEAITAGALTLSFHQQYSLLIDIAYENGHIVGTPVIHGDEVHDPLTLTPTLSAEIRAGFSLEFRGTLRIAELVGPYFALSPHLDFGVKQPCEPGYPEIVLGASGTAGLNLGLPWWNFDSLSYELFDKTLPFDPIKCPGEDGSSPVNNAPASSDVSVKVALSRPEVIRLPGGDADGDGMTWRLLDPPTSGTVGAVRSNEFTYYPRKAGVLESMRFEVRDRYGKTDVKRVQIEVLDKSPPVADFEYEVIGPFVRLVPCCTDVEDRPDQLMCRWDLEGDGVWDGLWTGTQPMLKTFSTEAPRSVVMEVRDTDGLISRKTMLLSPGDQSNASFVACAAGDIHSVALDKDGNVWIWGMNGSSGRLGDSTSGYRVRPAKLSTLPTGTVIKAISAGDDHTLLLDTSGNVWAFGENSEGELGDGTFTDRATPSKVSGLPTISEISAGARFSLALDTLGNVWGWGENRDHQLGRGIVSTTNKNVPAKAAVSGMTAIAAGADHVVALDALGKIWTWGANQMGQLGNGTTSYMADPAMIPNTSGFTSIAAGDGSSLAVKNGEVWGWGENRLGATGSGDDYYSELTVPTKSPITGAARVFSRKYSGFALLDGGVLVGWGVNSVGELGIGSTSGHQLLQQSTRIPTGVADVSIGNTHGVAVRNGHLWAWGTNTYGQLGSGNLATRLVPVKLDDQ